MRMKWQWVPMCLILMLAVVGITACNRDQGVEAARDNQPALVSPADQDFMMKATEANVAEIDMGRLALQKSTNDDVKDYANMIVKDHNDALQGLTDLTKQKNVQLRNVVPTEAEKEIARLNTLTGPDFDREFVNKMVTDHQMAVQLFRNEQGTAQDNDVKKYVDNTLPKLEKHLEEAQQLQSKLFSEPSAAR